MKSSRNSQAARRRAAAATAIAGVGAGILGTQSAEATPVTINLASFGVTGVNAGLTSGTYKYVANFPISGGGGLSLANFNFKKGIAFYPGKLAVNGGYASPHNFAAGAAIGSSSSFESSVHPGFLWVNRCGRMPLSPGGSSYVRHRSLPAGSGPFGPLEGG